MNGDGGDDLLENTGSYVTMNGGANDDNIFAEGNNLSIKAGGGEKNLIDVNIEVEDGIGYSNITIDGADNMGADFIYNEMDQAFIRGNIGYDLIENKGAYANILGGSDDDLLVNYGEHSNIYGESGNDYIYSDNATDIIIDGGENVDDIFAYHDIRASISGGEGNDRIFANRVSVKDKESLVKELTTDIINGFLSLVPKKIPFTISTNLKDWLGETASFILDKDKLRVPILNKSLNIPKNSGSKWISAVSDLLTIWKYLDPNSLLQQLNNAGSTVNGGNGDDIIVLDGFAPRTVEYSLGNGNDTIYFLATNQADKERNGKISAATHLSTLYLKNCNIDYGVVIGNDVILAIGENFIKLIDAAGFRFNVLDEQGNLITEIYDTNADNRIELYSSFDSAGRTIENLMYFGNGGNDVIYGTVNRDSIFGGNGNDVIYSSATNGGDFGDDYIDGGAGNDSICTNGSGNNTIIGGTGNDTIRFSGSFLNLFNTEKNLLIYNAGDGNDTVYGYKESDVIQITNGIFLNTVASGGDLIVNLENGSINLKDAANLKVTFVTAPTPEPPAPISKKDDKYIYIGGNRRIENYLPKEKVQLSSDFTGIDVKGNNFIIKSSSGELTLENARDKLIDVAGDDGNTAAYVYMASNEGDVKISEIEMFEVLIASDNNSNNLIAGDAGSILVGGKGSNILQGGARQDSFIYNGGNSVIRNYNSGEFLNYAAQYTYWNISGNNLIINAAEGAAVRIEEAKNKLVELADSDGNLISHVYLSTDYEGVIDGRGFNAFEVIVGSDNRNNQIYAGENGSSIYGGSGGNDDLYGNVGYDEFVYKYGDGQDNIFNAGPEDAVNLNGVSLEQLTGAEITDGGVNFKFTDGGSLNINGQVGNFILGGQNLGADYQNKFWYAK